MLTVRPKSLLADWYSKAALSAPEARSAPSSANRHSVISYSTIILYSRDHQGLGMAHEKNITKKPASLLSHDDVAVLVR